MHEPCRTIVGLTGASSTPRPLFSITTVSEYWLARSSRAMTPRARQDWPPLRYTFQTAGESSRSRGAFRPSFTSRSALVETRAQGRPGAGWHPQSVRYGNAHGVDHRFRRIARPSLRNGFNGFLRALPGERCTIAPVALRITDVRARSGRHITAGLDAQTPGVRTTRLLRPRTSSHASSRAGVCSPSRPCEDAVSAVSSARRQLLTAKAALQCHSRPTPSRPSHPSPRFVTIAIRPLSRARMFACTINPNFGKVEYLRCRGFDRS